MISPNSQKLPAYPGSFKDKASRFFSSYYPILLVFLLHHAMVALSTMFTEYSAFKPADFARYDSYLYIDIAKKGYELFHCWERFSEYPRTAPDWCGNAGWMPLYPLLMKGFMFLGMHEYTAGFLVSNFCYLAILCFLFSLLKHQDKTSRNISMGLAAIFPSSIYYTAVFPISLMLALVFGSFYYWQKQKYITANILALLIPLSYSTGFVSAVPWILFCAILILKKSSLWKSAFLIAVSIGLGYLLFFAIQKASTGYWNAFFMIQSKYGHGLHDVWVSIKEMLRTTWLSGLNNNWQNIQSLIFIVLLFPVFVYSFFEKQLHILFFNLCFIAYACFPLMIGSGNLSLFRSEALLLPLVIFLGQKKKLAIALVPVFLYLFFCCAIDFFTWKII